MSWFDVDILLKGCKELDVDLSKDQILKFEEFGELIQETNKHTNLTRVPPEEYISRHFLDSLSLIPQLRKQSATKIVDIGTGAGFPGIPLAIVLTEAEFLLIDSLQKRIKFIDSVVHKLNLNNVELLHGRAEEKGNTRDNNQKFDVAISRAVAPLEKLIPWMKPWIKKGGVGLAIKGPGVYEEAKKVSEEIVIQTTSLKLPHETLIATFYR